MYEIRIIFSDTDLEFTGWTTAAVGAQMAADFLGGIVTRAIYVGVEWGGRPDGMTDPEGILIVDWSKTIKVFGRVLE